MPMQSGEADFSGQGFCAEEVDVDSIREGAATTVGTGFRPTGTVCKKPEKLERCRPVSIEAVRTEQASDSVTTIG